MELCQVCFAHQRGFGATSLGSVQRVSTAMTQEHYVYQLLFLSPNIARIYNVLHFVLIRVDVRCASTYGIPVPNCTVYTHERASTVQCLLTVYDHHLFNAKARDL